MIVRIGISLDGEDLKYIQNLQKKFHIKSRSEFFRELVKRYEKLEGEFSSLRDCISGYINVPETQTETTNILKSSLKNQQDEDWQ